MISLIVSEYNQYGQPKETEPSVLIRQVHISHNTPCLPPKVLHNLCFWFLLGIAVVQGEIEDNAYTKVFFFFFFFFGGGGGGGGAPPPPHGVQSTLS